MSSYKELWAEYRNGLSSQEGIIEDGALNLEEWNNQDVKILFYYKETYGYNYNDKILGISDLYETWIGDNVPTYKRMGLLAYLIFETLATGKIFDSPTVNYELYQSLLSDRSKLTTTMAKVAAINVAKKSIPENRTNDSLIRTESKANKVFLKAQLKLLNPSIIICGGQVCADSLIFDTEFLTSVKYKMNEVITIDNKVVAPLYHLSYRYVDYEYIYQSYLQIINQFKKL